MRQEATIEICRDKCGAKCCKQNATYVHMTKVEVERLLEVKQFKVKLDLRYPDRPYAMPTDGGCIFLEEDLCTIYEIRPKTCRDFPEKPWSQCELWPV
jgi:Fe-S-cluster containining protein